MDVLQRSLFVLGQALAQLQKEHQSVAGRNSAGNPPLGAVAKEERTNDLDEHEQNDQQGDPCPGAGHDPPTRLQLSG